MSSLLVAAGAGSAAAEDCFPKIRAAAIPHAAPHKAAPPHRKQVLLAAAAPHPAHRRHIIRKSLAKAAPKPANKPAGAHTFAESSLAQQTIPVLTPRPVSCDKAPPVVLASAPPVREKTPAQVLLDELAGPSGTPPAAPPADVPEGVPGGVTFPADVLFPGTPGGVPPGGGQPPFTPPGGGQPPVVPPIVTPPDQPPFVPPDQPEKPPPFVPPPENPQPPPEIIQPPPIDKPPGAIPEPSTWAMLILGFFGLGAVLRARRTARIRLS